MERVHGKTCILDLKKLCNPLVQYVLYIAPAGIGLCQVKDQFRRNFKEAWAFMELYHKLLFRSRATSDVSCFPMVGVRQVVTHQSVTLVCADNTSNNLFQHAFGFTSSKYLNGTHMNVGLHILRKLKIPLHESQRRPNL